MYKRYPSVQSMSAFIQAARSGSFSSAARKLDLTHSAISQQIRALEDFIGQPLFVREGGGSNLTDAGQLFASVLSDGLAQIDRALSSVKNRSVAQRLTLDVDSELAQSWLNPRLPQLLDLLPEHEVVLLSMPRSDRSAFERVDLALRYGYGDWEDCEMTQICGDRVMAVAAPALLERQGVQLPLSAQQILELPLLGYTRRSWIPWLDAAGLPAVEPSARVVFDNAANLIAAAEAGVGAGLVRGLLAADALRSGRLVVLNEAQIAAHYNLYAVWPPGHGERVAPVVEAIRQLALRTHY
ncbi:LysR substrate-binding domain-containing protein [Pseudomonas sp. YuFO20]|jgi:LysR family glycine cleavage system transcriptional activator|uniref:LysR substrate-binding domain-containing protein n=1 Tax=Pseudomonas neuropathica TaxID=2730425 RepID=A0ACC7MZJ9_9PSED|nr:MULTISPECIES: LysR substrate-binding domain-containing protein [unclassified Pseudomonas]MEB2516327.1 LysR substrate-binding domain-containing protein [Pseudomonas sp. YuFO20]MEB2621182.1 LysR substrate-binding domain-containing protein [Pseudomonas sp. YuFO8]